MSKGRDERNNPARVVGPPVRSEYFDAPTGDKTIKEVPRKATKPGPGARTMAQAVGEIVRKPKT